MSVVPRAGRSLACTSTSKGFEAKFTKQELESETETNISSREKSVK